MKNTEVFDKYIYRNIATNYYIRKDHLEKEFLDGLQKRKIDEKFLYIGERQANSWINLCKSPEYDYYRVSKNLLQNHVENFVSDHTGDVNVIALGPGDALKEKIVVNHLQEKHRVNLFFVDTSKEILNIAIKNTVDSDVLKEVFMADLMHFRHIRHLSRYVKKHYSATNFFTLLGNTIGNYPPAMMLKTLRNAMTPGDKILIEVHAKSGGSIEEEATQIREIIKKHHNNPALQERILALLSEASIEEADGTIEVEFNKDKFFPQMGVIEQYFCFNRNKTITYLGEEVYFVKGERILVGYSNKYTFQSLDYRNILTSHGLHIIKHATDDTGKCYQLLCELA